MRIEDRKYPSLNGLRALSILFVILAHVQLQYNIFSNSKNPNFIVRLITDGQFAVNVFFVISGFLITSLLLKEENLNGKIKLRDFYIRRSLRILPAYFSLLIFYYCLTRLNYISISEISWLTMLTFTKYFTMDDWYTSHSWSLSIEEQFYLIWPFVFIVGRKSRKLFVFGSLLLPIFVRLGTYFYPVFWINQYSILFRIDAIAI